MKVFRRSQSPDSEAAMVPPGRSEEAVIGVPAHRDAGPILVAVDGHRHSWDALEWAAAEAAGRQCSLRILHAFHWSPTAVDLGGMSVNAWDAGAEEVAERVATKAACHARTVAPGLKVTTVVREGGMAEVVLREARSDALIVLGRGCGGGKMRSLTGSVSWLVARRAACPVTIVGLAKLASTGPSMGRVVVGLESGGDPRLPLGFAFRAAQRRGVGVTVVGASSPQDPSGRSAQNDGLGRRRVWRTSQPGGCCGVFPGCFPGRRRSGTAGHGAYRLGTGGRVGGRSIGRAQCATAWPSTWTTFQCRGSQRVELGPQSGRSPEDASGPPTRLPDQFRARRLPLSFHVFAPRASR